MKLFGTSSDAEYLNPKKHRRWPWVLLCAVLLLTGGVYGAWHLWAKPRRSAPAPLPAPEPQVQIPEQTPEPDPSGQQEQLAPPAPAPQAPVEPQVVTQAPVAYRDGVYNILLCGTDQDGYRTDTILIAHLDENTGQTALMSIPRDTALSTGQSLMKINSVYAGGGEQGMQRLKGTLQKLLGFPVDGYFLVDLEAFQQAVDLVGGVWFDVPQDMYYKDPSQDLYIDLKAGHQLLDGYNAMGLVRYRKGYASQDIQRTQVQQEFLLALARQCLSFESLPKLKGFAEIWIENVTTDLTVGNLLYFAKALMDCDLSQTASYTIEGEGVMVNGISYYPLYDWSVLEIVNSYFNPLEVPITGENIAVLTPQMARTYQRPAQPEPPESPEASEPAEPALPEDPLEPEPEAPPQEAEPPEQEFWEDPFWPDRDTTESTETTAPEAPEFWE